jgi:hypothetical protein
LLKKIQLASKIENKGLLKLLYKQTPVGRCLLHKQKVDFNRLKAALQPFRIKLNRAIFLKLSLSQDGSHTLVAIKSQNARA